MLPTWLLPKQRRQRGGASETGREPLEQQHANLPSSIEELKVENHESPPHTTPRLLLARWPRYRGNRGGIGDGQLRPPACPVAIKIPGSEKPFFNGFFKRRKGVRTFYGEGWGVAKLCGCPSRNAPNEERMRFNHSLEPWQMADRSFSTRKANYEAFLRIFLPKGLFAYPCRNPFVLV